MHLKGFQVQTTAGGIDSNSRVTEVLDSVCYNSILSLNSETDL